MTSRTWKPAALAVALLLTTIDAEAVETVQPIQCIPVVAAKPHLKGKKHRRHPRAHVRRRPSSASRSVAMVQTRTFNERNNFEKMVLNQAETARNPASFAPSARVVGVRRELALTNDEAALAPQDIILSTGSDGGLESGMILSVMRKIPMLNPYKENDQTELEIPFALVKIVHVQKDIAIARVEMFESSQLHPGVGTRGVLIGDYVGSTTHP